MRAELSALFPFYGELSQRARDALGALATLRARSNEVLLRRGDDAGGAYLVTAGALRVFYITSEGREATLYRVTPGGTCVLALSATLRGEPYPAWVQASREGGRFARIPGDVFARLVDGEAAFRSFVLRAMSDRIFELMGTLEQLATASILQRVAAHLAASGVREVATTQTALASELGTAREVVYRALRELAGRGLIVSARGKIRILDPAGLRRIGAGE